MKVLLVVHQFFPEHQAGTEVLTLELARGLRRNGHHVEILTGAPGTLEPLSSPPKLTHVVYEGISVHRVHYSYPPIPDPFALHSAAPDRVALVKRVVEETVPDIVQVNHFSGLSSAIIPAIRRFGIPTVFAATDYWAVCPQFTLLRTFDGKVCEGPGGGVECIRCCVKRFSRHSSLTASFAKYLAMSGAFRARETMRQVTSLVRRPQSIAANVNAASMVVCSTRFLANMLIRNGINAGLMRVVPYGVDIGEVPFRQTVPRCFAAATPLRLAFIGTIAEIKGPHILLDAVAALTSRAREIELHLYGQGTPGSAYFREISAKVDRLGGGVRLTGTFPHDRIGEVLSGYHFLVVPSLWYESTPLVLCAALAAGTPALVSRLGGMTEIIEEGLNGMSFPAGNTPALTELLRRLLDAPRIVEGLHATSKPRRRFTADYIRDIESAYFEILNKP